MDDETTPARGEDFEVDLDEHLEALLATRKTAMVGMSQRGGGQDWDAPLDLRIARPLATDLRAVWAATNEPAPAQLAGALGATRPLLLTHTLTPFPIDGHAPARVWALGYELVMHDVDANTVGGLAERRGL